MIRFNLAVWNTKGTLDCPLQRGQGSFGIVPHARLAALSPHAPRISCWVTERAAGLSAPSRLQIEPEEDSRMLWAVGVFPVSLMMTPSNSFGSEMDDN